jgi:HD-GYP domain-containing protein (c-di-GMP phosphodiesterase class II)
MQIEQVRHIPFVFYTSSYTSDKDEQFGLSLGASAFIRKPADPETLTRILLELFEKSKSGLLSPPEVAPLEPSLFYAEYSERIITKLDKKVAQLEKEVTERKKAEEKLKKGHQKLQEALQDIVNVLAATVGKRDPYTAGHQQRVAQLASAIAVEMGLTSRQVQGIHVVGSLHDIGKINVPIEILTKPGGIDEHERGIIQLHPQVGYEIIKGVDFPWPVAQAVLQHHERLDGSGYPEGISGEAISIEARVLAVADVVEAMSSLRPYREALGIDKALEEITQKRDVLYDPQVVDACVRLFREKGLGLE